MKVVCKTKDINTLTYMKVYETVDGVKHHDKSREFAGYIIIDDFENKQYYWAGFFWSIEEGRELKINSLLD